MSGINKLHQHRSKSHKHTSTNTYTHTHTHTQCHTSSPTGDRLRSHCWLLWTIHYSFLRYVSNCPNSHVLCNDPRLAPGCGCVRWDPNFLRLTNKRNWM